MSQNAAEKKLAHSLRIFNTSVWDASVASGEFVVQGQSLDDSYFLWVGGNLADETLYKMRAMKSCLYRYFTAFAFRKDSPFLDPFNRVVMRLKVRE